MGPRGGLAEGKNPRGLAGNKTGVLGLVTTVNELTPSIQRSRENKGRTGAAEHKGISRLKEQTHGEGTHRQTY